MRYLLTAFILFSTLCHSQTNTEVYLFDLKNVNGKFELSNKRNISNNDGYDNQPSFYNDNIVLFSSTRNGQTDIAQYNVRDLRVSYISNTQNGSEYSPTKIPGKKEISSIRLDKDGKQLLYSYDYKTAKSKVLVEDLVIGYHVWANKDRIVSFVLGDTSSLVVSNLKDKSNYTFQKNIGRSLHRIPNSQLVSYISKENRDWEIRSLDPISGATKKIINTIPQVEDMCWIIDGTILMAKGKTIFMFNPKTDKDWSILETFKDTEINNITRLATNETGNYLALVAEVSPEQIVQKQLDAYNARDIDAFMNTYSKDIKLYHFPNKMNTDSWTKMKKSYASFFDKTPDLHCEIKNRIAIDNMVIDEEYITSNGKNFSAVAIYEVTNGKISKVTFISGNKEEENPVPVVNKMFEAYKAKDLDALMKVMSEKIWLYNFQNMSSSSQPIDSRGYFKKIYDSPSGSESEVITEIVIGNKLIKEEKVQFNGIEMVNVTMFEVDNGKIVKITFIQ